jgi:NADH dehydrogenase
LGEGVEPVIGDVTDPASLVDLIDGCEVVVHLVGIIEESGSGTFDSVIRQGTENVVNEAKRAGVRHFVQMSALGAQDNPALAYMQAKMRSEEIVKSSGLTYTIIRPSVIFGEGDGFINALAGVVKAFPVIPVVGNGQTLFQPVAVSDVASAFAAVVNDPELAHNQTIELGGSDELTYEEMIDLIALELEKKKPKVHVPVGLMKLILKLSSPLPKALRPPVTSEQLKMLALDNSTDPAPLQRLIGREPLSLRGNIGYIRASRKNGSGTRNFSL